VPDIFLKRAEVQKRLAISKSEIYRRMKAGNFPKPIEDGPQRRVWRESVIIEEMNRIAPRNVQPASDLPSIPPQPVKRGRGRPPKQRKA
jgi:predicted DNA-binding transcriptional regulator AlpA